MSKLSIKPKEFSKDNITKNIDLVIYSIAYEDDHPELVAARALDIPVISLTESHVLLMKNKKSIARRR